MIEHRSPLSGVDAGPGPYVATAGYDSQVILWDQASRLAVARASHDHLANQCQFSPDGRALVSASSDYSARLWSIPDLRLQAVLGDHQDDVEMAAFDPPGRRVATACRDHHVRIFDRDGRLLRRLEGHEADVLSVSWMRSGDALVSSGDDGTVRTWCAATGRLLETIRLDGVETDTVAVDADETIYAGNDHGEIVCIRSGRARAVDAHLAGVKRLVLDRERRRLLSTSYDRNLKLWRVLPDGGLELLRSVTMPPIVWARSCVLDPKGRILLGTFGSSYALYDPAANAWDLSAVHDTAGVNAVCLFDGAVYTVGDAGVVARNGREHARLGSLCNFLIGLRGRLLTGGHLGAVIDASTGQVLYQHRSPLNCATGLMIGGAPAVLIGAYTGEGIVLKDRSDGGLEVIAILPLHEQAVKGVAANEERIFSVSAAADCAVHSVPDLRLLDRIPRAHAQIANGVAALPDGRFASVSRDRRLRVWRQGTATVVTTPHDHSIKCVCASASGQRVATGSYDGKVAVLDLATGAWEVHRPTAFGISCLSRWSDSDGFLASSYDGRTFVVDSAGARPIEAPRAPRVSVAAEGVSRRAYPS